jgi:hypothetical protein
MEMKMKTALFEQALVENAALVTEIKTARLGKPMTLQQMKSWLSSISK